MNTNEIEEKLEKDNQNIKDQIANLQNTIKKLKQDMLNNANDSKINISNSNTNSSLNEMISLTSLSNTNTISNNNTKEKQNNKMEIDNKNLGMKFSFNSYMFEQNKNQKMENDNNFDSKAFDEKLALMIKNNSKNEKLSEFNNNIIKNDNYKEIYNINNDNEENMNFIRSGCFYSDNNENNNKKQEKKEPNKIDNIYNNQIKNENLIKIDLKEETNIY